MRGMIAIGAIISGANPIPQAQGAAAAVASATPRAGAFARTGMTCARRNDARMNVVRTTTHERRRVREGEAS
jgi:hypothetical protein